MVPTELPRGVKVNDVEGGARRPSVLFVDDEPHVLDGIRRSLRTKRNTWTMSFCTSGEQALQALADTPCDVVVSDMRMPGMDGAELLSQVSRLAPPAVRVVLSGHTEPQAAVRAALVGHRFLSKPCDTGHLVELVEQVVSRPGQVGTPAWATASSVWRMPVREQQLQRLREVLATPDVRPATVVDAVIDTIWLAAKLLQLANSRFFGPGTGVASVADAVNALGPRFLSSLLDVCPDVWAVPAATPPDLVDTTYRHCLASARLAGRLATPQTASSSTTAALLQGVGRLALASEPAVGLDPLGAASTADVVGRDLLALWGLPETVTRAVADKAVVQRPDAGGLGVTATLRAARLLLQETGCADPHDHAHPEELAGLLAHPQLTAAGLDWRAEASLVAREVTEDLG